MRWSRKVADVAGRNFDTGTHLFKLMAGETDTLQRERMTGMEARTENLAMQRKFVEAVRQGKPNGERLEVWLVVEKFVK